MSNFRANPHEAYKEFKTLTAKLASCLSVEDVQKTSTILKVKTELVNINSRILTEATISVVDQICKSIDLDMKLKQLHEMEEESVEQACTNAAHLASELSTPAFVAEYRRFVARRVHPSVIFSDNGSNFIGANNYLRDLGRLLSVPQHQQSLSDVASASGIDWRFIPPSSPLFGDLWEVTVKATKHHLLREIGDQKPINVIYCL
ncbi:uncharacterized protein LOC123676217 isoform X2 [Harmonia axyridis]|uniref:uncharacterized protein LOC123676217 isoform X2 n=1 Tax=Harmonia axyridis TaxID=115357 RepID=UPI001E2766D2|nr:uncharacterized protein LOC123676217 isoform X2 [Harmonia axyridis]